MISDILSLYSFETPYVFRKKKRKFHLYGKGFYKKISCENINDFVKSFANIFFSFFQFCGLAKTKTAR